MSSGQGQSSAQNRPSLPRSFVVLVGLTSTAILLQAITAGVFVGQDGRDSWVNVHGVIADVTWLCALVTAIVAFRRVRPVQPRLWVASATLFVLALAQTGLGHLISDGGMDSLIVVHVPLAMIIFGLTIWLAVTTARQAHHVGIDPYDDSDIRSRKVSRSLTSDAGPQKAFAGQDRGGADATDFS